MITVLHPGLLTLVQDLGRDGHYAIGMPPSGALDRSSHVLANALVGNPPEAATLELTLLGPKLRFDVDATIAVTGAELAVTIDGAAVPGWTTLEVRAGQLLAFGPPARGCRGYLAVRGGIATEPFLGSRSTYTTSKIGGLDGTPLSTGDVLPVGEPLGQAPAVGTSLAEEHRPRLGGERTLRVVDGLCGYRFTAESRERFFSTPYVVGPESNRTGYRLSGAVLDFEPRGEVFGAGDNPSNVVDLGYPIGSIQVPNGSEPICLLRDAVTGGGYATLGTVIGADLDTIAQVRSPETVRFRPVSLAESLAARAERREALQRAVASLATG